MEKSEQIKEKVLAGLVEFEGHWIPIAEKLHRLKEIEKHVRKGEVKAGQVWVPISAVVKAKNPEPVAPSISPAVPAPPPETSVVPEPKRAEPQKWEMGKVVLELEKTDFIRPGKTVPSSLDCAAGVPEKRKNETALVQPPPKSPVPAVPSPAETPIALADDDTRTGMTIQAVYGLFGPQQARIGRAVTKEDDVLREKWARQRIRQNRLVKIISSAVIITAVMGLGIFIGLVVRGM
jgi:hypothetical protein